MIEISKNESKKILSPGVAYLAGVVSGLISIGMFLVSISEGFFAGDFFTSFSMAIVSGIISFLCFSPWKRPNFLIGGIMLLLLGVWTFASIFYYRVGLFGPDDVGLSIIWSIGFLLGGLSLFLRFLNTTFFKSIHKISQTKTFRLIAKIIFWSAIVIIGLLVITGLFSLLAGLSATTIIIILLVMIWLK
mgnify:CR=1 FL=1